MIAAFCIGITIALAFGRRTKHYDVDGFELIRTLKRKAGEK